MVWAAFVVGLLLALAALGLLTVRGIRLYRQFKRTSAVLAAPLASFEAKAAEVDRHLDAFEASSRELERRGSVCRRSRAQLQVLLDAIERAQAQTRWLRAFLPG